MARALSVCGEPGCPDFATHRGYCERHRKISKGRGSTRQWRKTRERILERDGHRCTAIENGRRCPETTNLHVDHITPKASGGTDDDENLTTLCARHNLTKGARCLSQRSRFT